MTLLDAFDRPLRSLRISVTDRCNLRCRYCMPEKQYAWLPRRDLLNFEEIASLASLFVDLGVQKLRITGGEPLLRHDLPRLVAMLAPRVGPRDLAMTTNAVLLAQHAAALARAGLKRLTISLDTLRPERFARMSGRDRLADVFAGMDAARRAGFAGTKFNAVILRGVNDDEICDLLEFGWAQGGQTRLIEYMDVGGATRWDADEVVPRGEMLARIEARFGRATPLQADPHAPAEHFVLADGRSFGIIASTTAPFCGQCDRARLTADGMFFLCLYARSGVNLRDHLRSGSDARALGSLLAAQWGARSDRGAEERQRVASRGPLYELPLLHADRHLEMHTRGG